MKVETGHKMLPFDPAIKYFRDKINMPTDRWNDLWQEEHARGFMIAGATETELLADFKTAVDKAIADGTSLAEFRQDFDQIVSNHGWPYAGSRGWRTAIIYSTNVRTAYSAGRWQQQTDPAMVSQRPYLMYRHGSSLNPRPEHLAWDGLILPVSDSFWKTHYPPNGWGCKCRVFSLSERDLGRMNKKGPNHSPNIQTREWEDKKTGKIIDVPMGIDPGFAYNPGIAKNDSMKLLSDNLAYQKKRLTN